jgi:hypothetical protein
MMVPKQQVTKLDMGAASFIKGMQRFGKGLSISKAWNSLFP